MNSVNHRKLPVILLTVILLGVAAALSLSQYRNRADAPLSTDHFGGADVPRDPAGTPTSGADRSEIEKVRIVIRQQPRGDAAVESADLVSEQIVGEYDHVGPLDAKVRDGLLRNRDQVERRYRRKLSSLPTPTTSSELLEQARLILKLIINDRHRQAIASGDNYVATWPGDPRPPLSLDGAVVLGSGGEVDGKHVYVTYIFPLAGDKELRDAHEYVQSLRSFDASEKARAFNSLPDDRRHELAAQIADIIGNPDATSGERLFVRDTIGYGNKLDSVHAIVYRR